MIELLKELVEDDVCQVNPNQGTKTHQQFPVRPGVQLALFGLANRDVLGFAHRSSHR